jgi:hypothetical protein
MKQSIWITILHVVRNGAANLINLLNGELNPICLLLALLGAHHILHVSRIGVNVMDLFSPISDHS